MTDEEIKQKIIELKSKLIKTSDSITKISLEKSIRCYEHMLSLRDNYFNRIDRKSE